MIMTELSRHRLGIWKAQIASNQEGKERFCNYTAELLAGSTPTARKYHKLQVFYSFVQCKQTGRGFHNAGDLFQTPISLGILFLVNTVRGGADEDAAEAERKQLPLFRKIAPAAPSRRAGLL